MFLITNCRMSLNQHRHPKTRIVHLLGFDSTVVVDWNFQTSLPLPRTHGINSQPPCEVSSSPSPPDVTHRAVGHSTKRASRSRTTVNIGREGETERERGREVEGIQFDSDTTGKLPSAHSTERKAHRRCGRQRFTYSSPPPHRLRPLRSDSGENGSPRRRRARLCGGGHRKEAHPQGIRVMFCARSPK